MSWTSFSIRQGKRVQNYLVKCFLINNFFLPNSCEEALCMGSRFTQYGWVYEVWPCFEGFLVIKIWKNFTYNLWSFITFVKSYPNFKKCQFRVSIFKFLFSFFLFFFNFNPPLEFSIKSYQNFQNTIRFLGKKKKNKITRI